MSLYMDYAKGQATQGKGSSIINKFTSHTINIRRRNLCLWNRDDPGGNRVKYGKI